MKLRTSRISLSGLFSGLTGLLAVILMMSVPVSAATTSTAGAGNGLRVSPVVTNITLNAGETEVVTVDVQNVTNSQITLQAFVNDFVAGNNESGEPALLLNPNQYAPSHSLKRYVAPISNVTLQPGEQKSVSVTISIPKDAPGGGYYGAVRFAPASTVNQDNVTLSASVGSLILVRVPGTFKENLNLLSLDVRDGEDGVPQVVFFGSSNIVVSARFQNTGDVQEQPFGKVVLKQGNTELASYEINNTSPRGNVLPDSIRRFTVKLSNVGGLGQYTVAGNFGYGANGQLLSGETTFYVIPLAMIITVLIVLALILFGIFVLPRLINRYNESVIRRARR